MKHIDFEPFGVDFEHVDGSGNEVVEADDGNRHAIELRVIDLRVVGGGL